MKIFDVNVWKRGYKIVRDLYKATKDNIEQSKSVFPRTYIDFDCYEDHQIIDLIVELNKQVTIGNNVVKFYSANDGSNVTFDFSE